MSRRLAVAWVAVALLVPACEPAGGSADDAWTAGEPALAYPRAKTGALYDEGTVVAFDLGFTDDAWAQFVAAWKPLKDTSTWFHCSFAFAGSRFLDAACRHRPGSGDPQDETKPQFEVRFDKWDGNGRFFGVRRVLLEARPDFAAAVRDRVAMRAMRQAGLQAPRVNHAFVTLNGRPLGLYENVEAVDHEFLEQRYEPPIGALFSWDNSGPHLQTNSSSGRQPVTDLLAEIDACDGAAGDALSACAADLSGRMDVDEFLRESAAEMALPGCDNFSNAAWDFYLYQDTDGRLRLLPWNLDGTFSDRAPPDADPWTFLGNMANSNLVPGPGLDIRLVLFQVDAWKAAYVDDLVAFRDGPLADVADRVAAVCAQIRPYVAKDPNAYGTLDAFDADCADVADRVARRIAALRTLLGR